VGQVRPAQLPIVFERDMGGYRLEKPEDSAELPGFGFRKNEIFALMTILTLIEQFGLSPSCIH
jgi:hypothetical protein